ncbi:hypothetical protein EMIT0P176_130036 [Pseudomonas sp. IT-P176]
MDWRWLPTTTEYSVTCNSCCCSGEVSRRVRSSGGRNCPCMTAGAAASGRLRLSNRTAQLRIKRLMTGSRIGPSTVAADAACVRWCSLLDPLSNECLIEKAAGRSGLHTFNGKNPVGVAPVAFVVHAVAEDVTVNARQPDEIGLQVRTRLAVVVLVDQYRGVHFAGTGVFAEVDDRAQGVPFVEDVVDDQHVTVDERNFRLGFPEQIAAAGFVAIARGVQVGRFQREMQMGEQLAREDQPAVHHAEHHGIAVSQLFVDERTDTGDGRLDFSFGVQAVSLSHDLTDMLEISGHGALQGVADSEKRAKVRIPTGRIKRFWTNVLNVYRTTTPDRLI